MGQLDAALKNIEKKYGGQVVETGIQRNDYDKIPFSSPRLNYMTYGGLPLGHVIEFSGGEGSGKTSTCFDIMKNAQIKFKEEAKKNNTDERKIVFIDVEGTFDYLWAKKFGLDTTKIIRLKMAGWPASDTLDAFLEVMKSPEVGLGILDSIAAMPADKLAQSSVGDKIYGGIALSLQNFTNQVKRYIVENNSMVLFTNQLRDNLASLYGGTTTPGGRGFKHACSIRIEFKKGKPINEENKELSANTDNAAGQIVNATILKSKIFPSNRKLGYYTIKFLTGPDIINDYVDLGLQLNVINQKGAFFEVINPETGELLSDGIKMQGREKLLKALQEHEEWRKLIDELIERKNIEELVDREMLEEANKRIAEEKE